MQTRSLVAFATLLFQIQLLTPCLAATATELPAAVAPVVHAAEHPVILADDAGAIAEILIQFSESDGPGIRLVLADLLAKLPVDVDLIVACPNQYEVFEFERMFGEAARACDRSVRVANVGLDISVWARDRLIARAFPSGRPASFIVPRPPQTLDIWRLNEHYAPFELESCGLLADVQAAPIVIEGGNVVSTRDQAFVGVNSVLESVDCDDPVDNEELAVRRLERSFGKPVMVIGNDDGEVPWDHVDMYITPVHDQVLLVADPDAGQKLLLLNELTGHGLLEAPAEDDVYGASPDIELFDVVSSQLQDAGYLIGRMPAVVSPAENWMITYNNVLIDERDEGRTVYMPVYGLPILDQYAASIYARLGLTVQTVDVTGIFERGGALRCVANVTKRKVKPAS